jgi:hypothetical protein
MWTSPETPARTHYMFQMVQSNSVGALGQVSIVSHSYQTYFGFPGSDLNLDYGLRDHVITRFASSEFIKMKDGLRQQDYKQPNHNAYT